ncbi:hypothetical protein FOZ63_032822 [Perkinsus olseni]|uniref:Uncharacterized protein n=1 Tax=Perkinsus olseni TaxID=32597 RepID=A0A7J6QZ15_PEROL|nr:hypothetical protein FOZ63_032822 [Perkinsus olseni]
MSAALRGTQQQASSFTTGTQFYCTSDTPQSGLIGASPSVIIEAWESYLSFHLQQRLVASQKTMVKKEMYSMLLLQTLSRAATSSTGISGFRGVSGAPISVTGKRRAPFL